MTVGDRFGSLTIVEAATRDSRRHARWLCKCDCGVTRIVAAYNLRSGNTVSCGCSGGKLKHGHGGLNKRTPEYQSWHSMMGRCYSAGRADFRHYGGRGIAVCERWHTFENFLADMGPRPSKQHTLDRFPDNDGNYEPSNCRWATKTEQANNRRPRRRS